MLKYLGTGTPWWQLHGVDPEGLPQVRMQSRAKDLPSLGGDSVSLSRAETIQAAGRKKLNIRSNINTDT